MARRREDRDPPHILPWGSDGITGELRAYIAMQDNAAREARGVGPHVGRDKFRSEGVERIADRERAKLAKLRQGRERKDWPRPAEISAWCYILQAYCAAWGEPAPAALLHLTFDVLALQEGDVAPEIIKAIGMKPVDQWQPFLDAARADGEADAAGKSISERKLAAAIGVTRPTINAWRQMRQYQDRRDMVALSLGKPSKHAAMWEEAHRRARERKGE